MKVVVLKEDFSGETRVSLVPSEAKKLIDLGVQVHLEKGAGIHAAFDDEVYKAVGVQIEAKRGALLKDADVILSVRPETRDFAKAAEHKKGAILIGLLEPYQIQKDLDAFAKAHLSLFALELVPRISRAQSMDVLSSQANLGGYRAVLEAAYVYGRSFPMMMTAAGTIKPAKVLVLGAGVAGLQAIATAKRLGAVVSAFDVRPEVKEQVESLAAKFIAVEDKQDGDDSAQSGGYAREMSDAYKKRQAALIGEHVALSDIVISTAQIPGKKAPVLVTKSMVEAMRPGSVLVDMAVEGGGNIESSVLGEVITYKGVFVVGYGNLPGRLASEASSLFSKNVFNLLQLMLTKEKQLSPDLDDQILNAGFMTYGDAVRFGVQDKKLASAMTEKAAQEDSKAQAAEKDHPAGDDTKEAKTESEKQSKKSSPKSGGKETKA